MTAVSATPRSPAVFHFLSTGGLTAKRLGYPRSEVLQQSRREFSVRNTSLCEVRHAWPTGVDPVPQRLAKDFFGTSEGWARWAEPVRPTPPAMFCAGRAADCMPSWNMACNSTVPRFRVRSDRRLLPWANPPQARPRAHRSSVMLTTLRSNRHPGLPAT